MSNLEQELYNAVCASDVTLLRNALSQGADVNILVESGISLLGRAIQLGNDEIIQTIIDAKHFLPIPVDLEDRESGSHIFEGTSVKQNEKTCLQEIRALQPGNSRNIIHSVDCPNYCGLGLFDSLRRFAFQRHGCDVNLPDFYDRMPLHYAAESGNVQLVGKLIQAGCRINVSDNNNVTPLHLAVSQQHEEVVEMLLQAGTRSNCKTRKRGQANFCDKCSALHIACSRGFVSIVQLLLKYGANMEILDASDRTPLLVAVKRAHHDVVRLLLYNGAKTNVQEIHGYTPLSEAVWRNDFHLVKMLLEAGAKVAGNHYLLHFTIRHHSFQLCELLVKYGAFLNMRDDSGYAPIHIAIKTCQIDILALLLRYGCSTLVKCSATGKTPVHIAIESMIESDFQTFSEVLQLLLNFGAKLDEESYTPGDTPLYRCIVQDKFMFAAELIRQGCNPNLGNVFSCTIDNLAFAVRKKHLRTVKMLIYSGFSLGTSPCLTFLQHNEDHCNDILQFLIQMKTSPMPLAKMCRIAIRKNLGSNTVPKVHQLPILPPLLKNYLLFYDVELS